MRAQYNPSSIASIKSDTLIASAESVEIAKHFHNYEHFFGLHPSPSGTVTRMQACNQCLPFELTSGANNFGSWVQIIGTGDTPFLPGKTRFDLNRLQIISVDDAAAYTIQFAKGANTAAADAAVVAKTYTGFTAARDASNVTSMSEVTKTIRYTAGDAVWARVAFVAKTGKKVTFYFSIHEYDV